MRRFNVSEWALHNRGLVLYFMVALAIIGSWSYLRLGQSEDPPFTFKAWWCARCGRAPLPRRCPGRSPSGSRKR